MVSDIEVEPVWIIYDGRALLGDTDDAAVFESFGIDSAKDDKAAIRYAKKEWHGYGFVLYRYDLIGKGKEREATQERMILVNRLEN